MKKIALLFLFIQLSVFSQTINYDRLDAFLDKHFSKTGEVDYDKIIKDSNELNAIITDFSKLTPNSNWTRNEIKAFWINVYNANLIKLVADNYPLKSINYIQEPFKKDFINIGGVVVSLEYIENEIIKEFSDPRMYFALYCATNASPKMKNMAFNQDNIESLLNECAIDFINDDTKNVYNKELQTMMLSMIFQKHQEEFEVSDGLVIFLRKYFKQKLSENTKIEYLNYDWNMPR
jgi:hypothetical protein